MVPPSPPRLRRRPFLIILGVVLVAVGALLAAWVTTVVGRTEAVLVVGADITRGDVIEPGDLVVARVTPDPSLRPVAAERLDDVVGLRAAVDMPVGSLLTDAAVTERVVPAEGESVVGVALASAQLPARPLAPGDPVRIVQTPRAQEDLPDGEPASVAVTVVAVREIPDTGQSVVDVTVPSGEAARLAALVATGRVAVVVDALTA